tara:strand:+ start:2189 stop:3307 length:1119 start_codon:yes stop_codon:yes gene_type:complete
MGDIKLLHNKVLHETKGGDLKLYFPHNLNAESDPDVIKDVEWLQSSGLKFSVIGKNRTNILYPASFDIANCFFERNQFEYVLGLNKTKNQKLSLEDFIVFIYSRFIKKSKISNRSLSYFNGFSKKDSLGDNAKKMHYFKYMCNSFDNLADDFVYTEDLKENVEKEDYVVAKFLKSNYDKQVLQIINFGDKKESKQGFRYLSLPKINCKGLNGNHFHDVINRLNDLFSFENRELYFNLICGIIYSQDLVGGEIVIDFSKKNNLIDSGGLFITETYIKMKSLLFIEQNSNKFNSHVLEYTRSKSKWFFNPSFLYKSLIEHCENINKILEDLDLDVEKDKNKKVFLSGMMEDLMLGMNTLGMFFVDEINDKFKKD